MRQLNQEYLDNHIKDECTPTAAAGGVLWLPLQRQDNIRDHANVKGCEGKCDIENMAFRLFSDDG